MQHNISDSVSQVKSGTIFDNFLITDDVKEAEDIGNETWGVTKVGALLTVLFFFYLFCACIKIMVINSYWLSPQEPEKKMKEEQDDVKRKEDEEKNKEQETGANEEDEDEDDEDENEIKEEPEEDEDEEETVPKDELWGGVIRDSFLFWFFPGVLWLLCILSLRFGHHLTWGRGQMDVNGLGFSFILVTLLPSSS